MSQTKLVATTGRTTGSPSSRRLRAEGQIPAVLYGRGMSPVSVTVDRRDLRLALSGPAGSNTVLDLQVDGTSYPAVIKEMQRHPIRRTVNHIDFFQVNMNEEITVSVSIRLEGEAKAVQAEGGLVDPAVDSVEVLTTPNNMPNEFVIDITDLKPGDVIRLADLPLPAGVTVTGDPEMPIVTVLMV
ncbi:MAG: 50S ribosomal protein L25, partial [Ilumatobacteraceae bacterium]